MPEHFTPPASGRGRFARKRKSGRGCDWFIRHPSNPHIRVRVTGFEGVQVHEAGVAGELAFVGSQLLALDDGESAIDVGDIIAGRDAVEHEIQGIEFGAAFQAVHLISCKLWAVMVQVKL
jgi:hypothetical protein